MGRPCGTCRAEGRRRSLPEGLAHLHELEEGDQFIDPTSGRVRTLVSLHRGRAKVSAGRSQGRTVQFSTFSGREVEFEVAASSQTEDWAPTTAVQPVAGDLSETQ